MAVSMPKQVYRPDYHCANRFGFVLEEIVVAEEKLGRHLTKHEVIYHLDRNRSNNDPDNIIVFKSKKSKDTYMTGGTLVQCPDGAYNAQKKKERRVCEYCGRLYTPRSKEQKYCSSRCSELSLRSENMPTKKELRTHLLGMSFSEISRIYNVDIKTVKSWCRIYGLPVTMDTVYKMRIRDKDKETRRIVRQLRYENAKLADKLGYDTQEDEEDDEDWLDL